MTDQDELRDRIAEIIERSLTVWMNDLPAGGAEADYAAQAIIDEFGLTVEERIDEPGKRGINPVQRVVGKWEEAMRTSPVRPEPGRRYFNHMAKHTRGEWHRNWLLTSGQYIKTSEPDMRKGYGWKIVGEAGRELVRFRT